MLGSCSRSKAPPWNALPSRLRLALGVHLYLRRQEPPAHCVPRQSLGTSADVTRLAPAAQDFLFASTLNLLGNLDARPLFRFSRERQCRKIVLNRLFDCAESVVLEKRLLSGASEGRFLIVGMPDVSYDEDTLRWNVSNRHHTARKKITCLLLRSICLTTLTRTMHPGKGIGNFGKGFPSL